MKIGVLGAGQLGRMIALAGYPLGLRFRFFNPEPTSPAGQLAEQMSGVYEDTACLAEFAQGLDVITYEFENVPVEATRTLQREVPVLPSPKALMVSQDRLAEKRLFVELGITTPPFFPIETREELEEGIAKVGMPAVVKTRRMGYDGKGQHVLRRDDNPEKAWQQLQGVPLLLEAFVPFDRELSQIAVRSRTGEVAFYPLVENHHAHGILHATYAPARGVRAEIQEQANTWTRRVLERLDYVGVLAIEFFQHGNQLLANEMAPRVHNSGHWTIEGSETCQFENHLRAILGWPLGSTDLVAPCAMINILGQLPREEEVLAVRGANLHLYGKSARPGRKLGHVTVRASNVEELEASLARLRPMVEPVLE